ncbi:hypothetical protein H5410_022316 [Solanum commersonii]|uniref:Zinc knuckle CX2CX4HX4C domain-containing protein n=1 Tax=Solanum commersonii TaxID=4109 RepID=A0A9J5ZDL9_SOLCO|nr:hypothetical protein H5410_022316 [Solanum commersonii]
MGRVEYGVRSRVKVEVDLLREFPKRITVGIKKGSTGKTISIWINICYDFMPKYCKACKLKGNNESERFVLHPEFRTQNEKVENNEEHQH